MTRLSIFCRAPAQHTEKGTHLKNVILSEAKYLIVKFASLFNAFFFIPQLSVKRQQKRYAVSDIP